jgi:hypothetical protein
MFNILGSMEPCVVEHLIRGTIALARRQDPLIAKKAFLDLDRSIRENSQPAIYLLSQVESLRAAQALQSPQRSKNRGLDKGIVLVVVVYSLRFDYRERLSNEQLLFYVLRMGF